MSDEVSDFLRSVERLKERREEEDEARSRELEEKILQEKRERQARRAGTPSPIQSCAFPPLHRNTHHITVHPVESGRMPSRTAHLKSWDTAACWNCPRMHNIGGMEVLTVCPCRARKIYFTTKVVPRKHPTTDCPPHRYPPVRGRRHKSRITRP